MNPVDIAVQSALNDHDPLTIVNPIFVFLGNLKLAYPIALTSPSLLLVPYTVSEMIIFHHKNCNKHY